MKSRLCVSVCVFVCVLTHADKCLQMSVRVSDDVDMRPLQIDWLN